MTTKQRVLQVLLDNKNNMFSGEELAKICSVSRTAIWKAVNSLRAAGYSIVGSTNGGYKITKKMENFSCDLFEVYFSKHFSDFSVNHHCECFNQIDSTNSYVKRVLSNCGNLRSSNGELTDAGKKYHTSAFIAETQTAGRGRLGRTFYSPNNTGIYLSIIYAPLGGITNPASLTACTGVAVCRAIEKIYNVKPKIKWINDIFLNGKKIAGILTEGFTNFESGSIETAIIGIGINIEKNVSFFPNDVQNIVGSILPDGESSTISRIDFAAEIVGQVLTILKEPVQSVIREYKELSFLLGKELIIHPIIDDKQSVYKATAIDITDDASLIVELNDGTQKVLTSGEVTLKSTETTVLAN